MDFFLLYFNAIYTNLRKTIRTKRIQYKWANLINERHTNKWIACRGPCWRGMSCWIPAKFIEITKREMSSCHSGTKETLNEATSVDSCPTCKAIYWAGEERTHGTDSDIHTLLFRFQFIYDLMKWLFFIIRSFNTIFSRIWMVKKCFYILIYWLEFIKFFI